MYPTYQQYGTPAQFGAGIPTMPKAKYTQPLTPEMISKLRSSGDAFKIEVSQEDLWRAACTHKENGQPTLVSEGVNPETGNEILRCTICGKTFEMVDASKEEVQKAVDLICNLLQTSKTMYLDAPVQLVEQYYQMLPLLEMFPKLYERSQKNFAMYENAMGIGANPTAVGTNGFQMMGAMLSNPYSAYGPVYGQPMYGQIPGYPQTGFAAPQPMAPAPQAPVGYPGYPQQFPQQAYNPAMYGGNPMMYNSGAVAPAPAPAPVPGVVPQAPVAPTDGTTEVQQQKQFNV